MPSSIHYFNRGLTEPGGSDHEDNAWERGDRINALAFVHAVGVPGIPNGRKLAIVDDDLVAVPDEFISTIDPPTNEEYHEIYILATRGMKVDGETVPLIGMTRESEDGDYNLSEILNDLGLTLAEFQRKLEAVEQKDEQEDLILAWGGETKEGKWLILE